MMQNMRILNSKEIKQISKALEDQFGFSKKLDSVFLMNQKNRIYLMSKGISEMDLDSIRKDSIGMYFAHMAHDGVRPTIEGSQLVGPHSKKNIMHLDAKQLKEYVRGFEIDKAGFSLEEGYYLVKSDDDFLGCVKVSQEKILSFISKARRLKVLSE